MDTSFTPQEVADMLKIAKTTVYELIKRGDLNSYRVGNKMRIEMKDIEKYISNKKDNKSQYSLSENNLVTPVEFPLDSVHNNDFIQAKKRLYMTATPRLYNDDLRRIPIPIPPIEEQKQIVEILDKTFESIEQAKVNIEKNIENAKELFQSRLNEIFSQKGDGWEEKKLGKVCKTGAGGTPLKSKKEYYENGNIPWLCSGEVKQGNIYSSNKFITQKGLDNSSAKLFPKDTVVIAMYGATAGDVGILRFETSTNQAVCGILPNDILIPEFIYYSFSYRKNELIAQATGNAQPNISQIKIKNTLIPILEKKEQLKIIEELDSLKEQTKQLENHYKQKLKNLEELKKSILQKAFSGELLNDS